MRVAAAVLLLLGVALAGCGDGAPGDTAPTASDSPASGRTYSLITVTGELVVVSVDQTGPAAEPAFEPCPTSRRMVELRPATKEAWLAAEVTNWVPSGGPLLLVSNITFASGPDCPPPLVYGSANGSFSFPHVGSDSDVRYQLVDGTWHVDGMPLPAGSAIVRPVEFFHRTTQARNGTGMEELTMRYQGNVTFRNEGEWPVAKMRTVPYTWTECCPPVAPPAPPVPPPPVPPPVLYHVLAVKAIVTRTPPATPGPTPNAGSGGACVTPHGISIDPVNGTAYVVEGRHPVDPETTRLIVHQARGGRDNCNADQAWVVAASDTWRIPVGGGEFTFPISVAPWANGTYVSGRLLRDDGTAADRELTLQRSLESDGVRWTVDAEFRLLGPWSMDDLHELPTDEAPPRTAMWAMWRT